MFDSHIADIATALMESESVTTSYAIELLQDLSQDELEQVASCLESEGCDEYARLTRKLYKRMQTAPKGWEIG
jgi:hypothetical protein